MKRRGSVRTLGAEGRGWQSGLDGVRSRHVTKGAAGRRLAQRLAVEQTIHRRNRRITAKNSYGNDPFPSGDGR